MKEERKVITPLTKEERKFICFLRYKLKRSTLPLTVEIVKNQTMTWRELTKPNNQ